MKGNVLLITQARTGSSRLPGKVLEKVQGKELLLIQLERMARSTKTDAILVATTTETGDSKLANLVGEWGYKFYRGSEIDVLDRYYQAAKNFNTIPEWVVRVTSDCPLLDPNLVDDIITKAQKHDVDYATNNYLDQYPDGQGVEVFKFSALEKAWLEATLQSDREHVTPFIKNNSNFKGGKLFKAKNFPGNENFSHVRMTVDEPKDLVVIEKIISELGTDGSWVDYTEYYLKNNLLKINGDILRNEGYFKSLKNDKNE